MDTGTAPRAADGPQTIELQQHTFSLDGAQAALMLSTPAALVLADPGALRAQFEQQGYLLVRGLVPRPLVLAVEAEIRAAVAAGPQVAVILLTPLLHPY